MDSKRKTLGERALATVESGGAGHGERAPGAGAIEPGLAGAVGLCAVRAGAGLVVCGQRLTTTCRPERFQNRIPREHCRQISWKIAEFALRPVRRAWWWPHHNLWTPRF